MRSLLAHYRSRWKRLSPLARDVTVVLALKVAALSVLWSLFFSAPVARQMSVPPDRVAERLVAVEAGVPSPEHADALR